MGVAVGGTNDSTSLESAKLQSAWRESKALVKWYSDSRKMKLSRHVTKLLRILGEVISRGMGKCDDPLPNDNYMYLSPNRCASWKFNKAFLLGSEFTSTSRSRSSCVSGGRVVTA